MSQVSCNFGEFELDSRRYELRRNGQALKLERIPMELLLLLVEKDGSVVTRQEIVDRLWGKDVFVDTEHGINTAVRKIRLALRDDSEQPRFVQTVAGKGYRFIGQKQNGSVAASSVSPPEEFKPIPVPPRPWVTAPRAAFGKYRLTIVVAAIFTLCVLAYFGYSIRRNHSWRITGGGHIMMAVLPFENLSGDSNEDYFSDGLTEEMISQLGALSPEHLGVIARTSSMAYKHTSKNVQQIGEELGVDYVLESGVRRDNEQIRITTQLIRTRDQVNIWAQAYDRRITGSIALQEEVAKAVAQQIEVKLSPDYLGRRARSQPDQQAYEAYLRGRYFSNQFTPEGYRKAVTYFEEAIHSDPDFAEAYSGISDAYRFLVITDSISPSEGSPKITETARKALLLNDSLAESHNSMAGALMDGYDWKGAEEEFKRAIALNPSYSSMHRIYAAQLAAELRPREALTEINEAMRTDPLSLPNNAEVVRDLYYTRDYDGALSQARKAMQLDPDYYRTHFWMGRVYAQKHMYPEAAREAEIVLHATPESTLAMTEMAYSLAAGNRQAEARAILRRLEERAKTGFVPAYNLAIIHIALNESDAATKLLQKAYDEHDWALLVMACEPRLDPLRSDARFQALQKKLGLPPI